ncbi:MAG: hypothetical protein HN348_24260 [Proteobacteria bacterium]|nr:hypothetical protein [Pseudomonadota bacterium]
MRGKRINRTFWITISVLVLGLLAIGAVLAPEGAPTPVFNAHRELGECMYLDCYLAPWQAFPMGTDERGIPLLRYAMQGASIVIVPAIVAGFVVLVLATIAGLVRCRDAKWLDTALQGFTELVGALPRLVVILVVAVVLPRDWRVLMPIALTWAILASPSAMDEAATTAERLGGAKFVEALKAHGFSGVRIFLYHVVWLNLRAVIVRQAAEVAMQVVFLEIALSYLAKAQGEPSFTHPEGVESWALLLYQGYSAILGEPLWHAMFFGLVLVALTAVMAQAVRLAARAQ